MPHSGKPRKGKQRPSKTTTAKVKPLTDTIRLNKFIANSGVCSRREADTYIATGLVTVNGKVINQMGFQVKKTDDVRFDGKRIIPEPPTYILLNKPKGVATTTSTQKGLTVMDLIARGSSASVKPMGRLGRNATGLLLFTNDDAFRQKLSKKGITRLFHVELNKNLKFEDLKAIQEGLTISEDKTIQIETISYVENSPKKEVGIALKHTGNQVIRDIFEKLNYQVVRLDCVRIGHLTKKDLPRGRFRTLTASELQLFHQTQ